MPHVNIEPDTLTPRNHHPCNTQALKSLATDARPEVRNSAVRTLFLAMGAHGGKFDQVRGAAAGVADCVQMGEWGAGS